MASADWTIWGLTLLVGFPLLVIVLGEWLQQLEAKDTQHRYLLPLALLRNGVLPLAFIDVTLREIVGLSGDHVAVKIADTGLWIVILNAALAILNNLLFREDARLAGRLQIPRLLLDLMRLFLVLCGSAIVVSQIWGFDLSSLIAALGVGSVVIGLALQDTLGSVFAGIALVSNRQFRVGDWIKQGSEEGRVVAMNWRAVKIRTRGGEAIFIPNGSISKATVQVIAAGVDTTSVPVIMKLPTSISPDRVAAVMNDVAANTAGYHLTPPPSTRVTMLEDGGITYSISVRVEDPQKVSAVRSEYLSNLWFAFRREGFAFNDEAKAAPDAQTAADDASKRVADVLETLGAFRVPRDELERMARQAKLETYRTNETIVPQDFIADRLYVIVQGRAIAVFEDGADGSVPLHEFERGQVMMAKSLFQNGPTPYTFRAETELELVALPVADFKAVCAHDASLAHEIEQILTARDEAANRVLAKALPDMQNTIGLSDRVQLMREMFRS